MDLTGQLLDKARLGTGMLGGADGVVFPNQGRGSQLAEADEQQPKISLQKGGRGGRRPTELLELRQILEFRPTDVRGQGGSRRGKGLEFLWSHRSAGGFQVQAVGKGSFGTRKTFPVVSASVDSTVDCPRG